MLRTPVEQPLGSGMVAPDATQEEGFALVLVLWTLLLLSLVASSLIREVGVGRVLASTQIGLVQSRLLADAAINRAIISLLDARDVFHWQLDGAPQQMTLFGSVITVSVASENGKLDLNNASPKTLAALFRGGGAAPSEADMIAERVVEWRSTQHLTSSTTSDYQNAGRLYGPRNGPFRSVGELRLVLGMSDTLQAAVEPLLTVWSGHPDVDRSVASTGMLSTLEAAGDSLAASQRAAHDRGNAAGTERAPGQGEVFSVSARLSAGRLTTTRTAVVQVAGSRTDPYRIYSWR